MKGEDGTIRIDRDDATQARAIYLLMAAVNQHANSALGQNPLTARDLMRILELARDELLRQVKARQAGGRDEG